MRDRKHIQQWIERKNLERMNAAAAEIEELDKEADRLADKLEEQLNEKRKREFELRSLKDDVKLRKTYPRGVPPGPSREELREQSERDAEKKRKDAEFRLKCQQDFEREPMQLFLKDVQANIARDPEFYRRKPAPAHMRREFLSSTSKDWLNTARAEWPKRYGSYFPEIMTNAECNRALKVGRDLLYPQERI